MKTVLLSIIMASCAFGCKTTQEDAREELELINYVQDPRSKLCFAVTIEYGELDSGRGLAAVPCDAVEHLIDLPLAQ